MSGIIAASVAVGLTAASSIYTGVESRKAQKKAQKKAEEDALAAEKQSRKAEAFAETEGQGIGQLGQVSLEVDDEEEDPTINNLSI